MRHFTCEPRQQPSGRARRTSGPLPVGWPFLFTSISVWAALWPPKPPGFLRRAPPGAQRCAWLERASLGPHFGPSAKRLGENVKKVSSDERQCRSLGRNRAKLERCFFRLSRGSLPAAQQKHKPNKAKSSQPIGGWRKLNGERRAASFLAGRPQSSATKCAQMRRNAPKCGRQSAPGRRPASSGDAGGQWDLGAARRRKSSGSWKWNKSRDELVKRRDQRTLLGDLRLASAVFS